MYEANHHKGDRDVTMLTTECEKHEMIGCQMCCPPARRRASTSRREHCDPVVAYLDDRWWHSVGAIGSATNLTAQQVTSCLRLLRDVYEAVEERVDGCWRLVDREYYDAVVRNLNTDFDWPDEGRRA